MNNFLKNWVPKRRGKFKNIDKITFLFDSTWHIGSIYSAEYNVLFFATFVDPKWLIFNLKKISYWFHVAQLQTHSNRMFQSFFFGGKSCFFYWLHKAHFRTQIVSLLDLNLCQVWWQLYQNYYHYSAAWFSFWGKSCRSY